jgi:hypothetical protein
MHIGTELFESTSGRLNLVTKLTGAINKKNVSATVSTIGTNASGQTLGLDNRLYETMVGLTVDGESYLFDHDSDLQQEGTCPYELEYSGSYYTENEAIKGHETIVNLITNITV